MKKNLFWVSLFALITLVFFFPYFFQNKIPLAIDIPVGTYYPWLNESFGYPVRPPVKNPILTDTVSQFWIWRNWGIEGLRQKELKIWNPYSLSGYPMSPWFHTLVFSPVNVFYLVLPQLDAMSAIVIVQIFISLVGMFYLGRLWLKQSIPALGVSFAWTFSSFFVGWLTWGSVSSALSFFPCVLYFVTLLFKAKKVSWKHHAGYVFSLTALILSGHPQTIFYTLVILFLYACLCAKGNKKHAKKTTRLFFGTIISFLLVLPALIPSIGIIKNSIRFDDPFLAENNYGFVSWGKLIISLISINFFGNPATGNYWGGAPNFQEKLVNFGTLSFVLALAGFIALLKKGRKTRFEIFLLICFVLGFFISTEYPFGFLIYEMKIPLVSSGPATRGFIISIFAGSFLMGKVLVDWFEKGTFKGVFQSFLFVFFLFVVVGMYYLNDNHAFLKVAIRNSIVSLGVVVMGITTLFIGVKYRRLKQIAGVMVVSLILFEGYLFFSKYTPFVEKRLFFPASPSLTFLQEKQKESTDFFRIERESAEIFPANLWHEYGLYSTSGYDPLYLKSYSEYLVSKRMYDTPRRFIENGNANIFDRNEFGVKYLMVLKRNEKSAVDAQGNIPSWVDGSMWKEVYSDGPVAILENTHYAPPYFFIKNSNALITLEEKKDEYWKFKVKNEVEDVFVLIENMYPGWKVYVDGKQEDIVLYEKTFKSLRVPVGEHIVEFVFENSLL